MKTTTEMTKREYKNTNDLLSIILKKEFMLYTKTLEANNDFEGNDSDIRQLFYDQHINDINHTANSTLDQIRRIDSYAPATLRKFLNLTRWTENSDQDYIHLLLDLHKDLIHLIRDNIFQVTEGEKDTGLSSFLNKLMQDHEEMTSLLNTNVSREKPYRSNDVVLYDW